MYKSLFARRYLRVIICESLSAKQSIHVKKSDWYWLLLNMQLKSNKYTIVFRNELAVKRI